MPGKLCLCRCMGAFRSFAERYRERLRDLRGSTGCGWRCWCGIAQMAAGWKSLPGRAVCGRC
ncbi:unnamed protein product [Symbiodinium sp. KB8]|nr:unnamed protein product [Symbiodinium sp. KB8]